MAQAALPIGKIFSEIAPDQGPLKYYLLHAVLFWGRSEFLLRLPSLFFDLASILMMFFLGRILFSRKAALLACFFMAVSIWHIHYATSIRTYPLYIFWLLTSTTCLCRAVKTLAAREWLFFAAATGMAFYSFYPSLFFLAAQVIWFFLYYGKRSDLIKRFLMSLGLFLAMVAPAAHKLWGAFSLKREHGIGIAGLHGYRMFEDVRNHFAGVAGAYPWGIIVFALSFIWVFYFQKKKSEALLLLLSIIVPLFFLVICVYSFQMAVHARYFLFTYPFFLLMAASGIVSCSSWVARLTGVFVFLLPLGLYLFFQAGLIEKKYVPGDYAAWEGDASGVAGLIEKYHGMVDSIVIEPFHTIYAVQYYLDKANQSPVVELLGNSGESRFCLYTNPKITLYGADGEWPLLKSLARAGRLLVIDNSGGGGIKDFKNGHAIISWLRSSSYRIERDYHADFYFISPPLSVSGNYRDSLELTRQNLYFDSRVMRRVVYPFNRAEWARQEWNLREN
jgi:hypothetical protein